MTSVSQKQSGFAISTEPPQGESGKQQRARAAVPAVQGGSGSFTPGFIPRRPLVHPPVCELSLPAELVQVPQFLGTLPFQSLGGAHLPVATRAPEAHLPSRRPRRFSETRGPEASGTAYST